MHDHKFYDILYSGSKCTILTSASSVSIASFGIKLPTGIKVYWTQMAFSAQPSKLNVLQITQSLIYSTDIYVRLEWNI